MPSTVDMVEHMVRIVKSESLDGGFWDESSVSGRLPIATVTVSEVTAGKEAYGYLRFCIGTQSHGWGPLLSNAHRASGLLTCLDIASLSRRSQYEVTSHSGAEPCRPLICMI